MIAVLLFGCSSSGDTADLLDQNSNSPYIAEASATVSQGQEARWLVEYSNANDVQFLFSSQDEGGLQFSIYSSEGNLIWSIDTQSPSNESYRIDPDCEGFCSFVAKSYVHSASDPIFIDLRILANSHDDVVMTSLP